VSTQLSALHSKPTFLPSIACCPYSLRGSRLDDEPSQSPHVMCLALRPQSSSSCPCIWLSCLCHILLPGCPKHGGHSSKYQMFVFGHQIPG